MRLGARQLKWASFTLFWSTQFHLLLMYLLYMRHKLLRYFKFFPPPNSTLK